MKIETADQARDFIERAGQAKDCPLNLYVAALAFSKLFHPEQRLDHALAHMEELHKRLKSIYEESLQRGIEDSVALQHQCLVQAVHKDFLYQGDDQDHNNPMNANMFAVIERRRGESVALGILYIHLAREMEWRIKGLNFPGHFLLRHYFDGDTIILDPFNEGHEVDAAEMRRMLKAVSGQKAELSHDYYTEADDHEIIMRLQNQLKNALILKERYEDAVTLVEALKLFDPQENRLYFDSALLKVKAGQVQSARLDAALYIEREQNPKDRAYGEQLLFEIERSLN